MREKFIKQLMQNAVVIMKYQLLQYDCKWVACINKCMDQVWEREIGLLHADGLSRPTISVLSSLQQLLISVEYTDTKVLTKQN